MKNKKVELLAPAGTYTSMIGAFNAGADAVYVGGNKFGARANAINFDQKELIQAINYAHMHGKSLYLTLNTLLKNHELENELYEYLYPYYEQGLDAVIVQDIGVLRFIRKHFPHLTVHASTQMTITGLDGARFMEKLGLTRIVTARELSLSEIEHIHKNTNIEIESFVHGALCYCYSGQCLYSSIIGGRSGNRGRCAQPCRLPYKVMTNGKQINRDEEYILSPKDMCTIDIIPELIKSGVYSFKIEGRMKSPEYTAGVVSIYRKYIDQYLENNDNSYQVSEIDRKNLMDLYNRGGFNQGYYNQHNGRDMISLVKPNHFGVLVGKILEIQKSRIKIQCLEDIHIDDVVEIRNGNIKIEEFVFKSEYKKGANFSIPIKSQKDLKISQLLYRTRNNQLLSKLQDEFLRLEKKEKIKGVLILSEGFPATLKVAYKDVIIDLVSDIVKEAINQPMTEEKIRKQIKKTGNTPFEFEHLDIRIEGNIFIPLQKLNELRREALEKLELSILSKFQRKSDINTSKNPIIIEKSENTNHDSVDDTLINKNSWKPVINAYIEKDEFFYELLTVEGISNIYVDTSLIIDPFSNPLLLDYKKLGYYTEACHNANKGCFLVLPHIFRRNISKIFKKQIEELLTSKIDGIIVKNLEELSMLKEYHYNKNIITDHNLYTFNKESMKFLQEFHISYDTTPIELNFQELKARGCKNSELIVYGYLPMMVTAGCIKKTLKRCDKQEETLLLKDRYGKDFSVKNNCTFCSNTIYNSSPLVLAGNKDDIKTLSPRSLRLHFTLESTDQVRKIAKAYTEHFIDNKPLSINFKDFTRGHFKRGIE